MQLLRISTMMILCYFTCNAEVINKNAEKQKVEKVSIKNGVIHEEYEKAIQESKENALVGKFAISGNSMVFSKTKSLKNDGQLYGFLEAKGEQVFDNALGGAIVTDGEGNGVASTAFSAFGNKNRKIDRKIPSLVNNGVISGGTDLQGGEAEVHGYVEGTATGNGVVLYGLSDYGLVLGSDGSGGSIENDEGKMDGKAGASKIKSKGKEKDKKHKDKHKKDRKSKDKHKNKSKDKQKDSEKSKKYAGNSDDSNYGKLNLDGSAGASSSGKGNNFPGGVSPETVPKIDQSDITGKSAIITIENLENSGQISGGVYAKTSDGYIRKKSTDINGIKVEEHNQPQWRSISLSSSGNGVAAHTFVTSPTRQNFSTKSKNHVNIDKVNNSGNVEGKGEFVAGNMATINYTSSFAVANGISLSAYSDNNVGHHTTTNLKEVNNKGKISGSLNQRAGENTGSGWHEYSDATAVASGNGISLFSRSSNSKNEMTEAHIKNVKNEGIISGELESRAGFGNGQSINSSKSSGNGIAIYAQGGTQNDTSVESISNKGVITGKALIYGGKDTAAAYSEKNEKRFYVKRAEKEFQEAEEDLRYSFTEEEKKKGTEVFKKKQEEENKKLDNKLKEFKEILHDSEANYTKLKKEMMKKEELLKKASIVYIGKLELDIKEIQDEIKKKEELMKWSSNSSSFKQEIKQLKEKIEKKNKEKDDYKNQAWENIEVQNLLKFYDDKITAFEEQLDQKIEEKNKKLLANEEEIKKIEKEIERVSNNKYYWDKEKKLEELKTKKKTKEEEKKDKDKKVKEEFLSEKEKIEKEIEKLKEDLKDKEIQEFLAVLERREFSEATIKHLEKLKEENMNRKNPMTKQAGHKEKTIHTEVLVSSSGNGISISQDGTKDSEKESLKNLENEGVISGYTEIYRGNSNQEYSRVGYNSSGAGLSVKGKMKGEIKNAGILSGNEFAILAEGNKDTSQSLNAKYRSGFEKVNNYGILAGRIIIGGYASNLSSKQDYDYFETKDSQDGHKNYGLYLVLDKEGNVSSVIKGNEINKYQNRNIINLAEIDGTHKVNENNIENKIVNGVGKNGVIQTEKEVTINNSIINGFYKAIKIGDNSHAILQNSIINTNGFGTSSYAIVGTDKENELTIREQTTINGKIDLGKGNDRVNIVDGRILSEIELGEGYNTLAFKTIPVKAKLMNDVSSKNSDLYIFQGNVKNANNIEVERDTKISETAKISGIENLNIAKGKKLIYGIKNKSNQAFYGFKNQDRIVNLEGEGDFLLDDNDMKFAKLGDSKDILGWELRRNGRRAYLESEKIYEARRRLGINLSELQEMAEEKEIYLNDVQTVLSNIYKNPRTAYSSSIASGISSYYKLLVDTEKFIPKGKLNAIAKTWKFENKEDGYITNLSGKAIKVNYGFLEHTNLGLNVGSAKQNTKGKFASLKQDAIFVGAEILWKKNNFSWNNGINYGKVTTKNGADAFATAIFSAIKYEIPFSKNWSVVPQASVLLGKISQKQEVQKLKNEQGKEIGEIYIPKQKQNYMELDLGLSLFKRTRIGHHQFNFDIGMEYSMPKNINSTRVVQTEKVAGGILKNEWKWDSPRRENTWVGFTGLHYQHENGISVNLKFKRNHKNMRNSSLGIGYLF